MLDSIEDKTFALFANPSAHRIAENLKKAGAKVFAFPPAEIEKIFPNENEIKLLKNLLDYDWIIFLDIFSVKAFLELLEEYAIDSFEMDLLRVCAAGEAIADRLRFASVHSDVIPPKKNTDAMFAALIEYVGANELRGLKFLLPKEFSDTNQLTEKLKDAGAAVAELPIYKIKLENKSEIARLKTLLKGGAIDEFVFTSPTDFDVLKFCFNTEHLADVFIETHIAATDVVTLQTAREHDLKNVALFHLPI